MFKLIPLTFQTGRNHDTNPNSFTFPWKSIRYMLRPRSELGTCLKRIWEKKEKSCLFSSNALWTQSSRCKITRPREQNCGRLASSTKVSDISSMGATTRERGVLCHRQLAIIYFAVSRMKTSAPHTIDDVHRIGIADSTSYLIESIIAFERCSGKHAIGHAIGDKL